MDSHTSWTRRIIAVGTMLPLVGVLSYLSITGAAGALEGLLGIGGSISGFYFGMRVAE